jgi:hypothetical protein
MAGAGYKLFNTGDVLTAAQVNTYLQEQAVMVFADASARTTALSGVLAEGMITYLKSDDKVYKYTGAAWVEVGGGSSPLTTKGDLYTYSTTDARLAVGTNGQYLKADSTAATGLAWATLPASGKLLQVVEGSTTTYTNSTSTTYADTNLSASITPSSTSSKILVIVTQNGAGVENNAAGGFKLRLVRGATEIAQQTDGIFGYRSVTQQGARGYSAALTCLDSPSTTSATTYKTQFATTVGTCQVAVQDYLAGANSARSSIILMEIGA